jgi:hypothetical protein
MSVHRDKDATVTFEHPFPGPLTATVYRGDLMILESGPLMPSAGRYTLPLSYRETQFDGRLDINWRGLDGTSIFTRTTSVEVITPLVDISDLRTLFQDTNKSDTELKELEEEVRIFIQSYTQQDFGYEIGAHSVVGNGETKVALPKRLIKAHEISGGPVGFFGVANNGWYLYLGNKNYFSIKEMPPEDFIDNNVYMTQGVIFVPDMYWKKFRTGVQYKILGEWGYYSVPDDVRQAAILLAKDFGTGENLYRDRYLDTLKAGDWNFKFTPGAFRGTGNVRADKLLDPYRRQGMVII